MVIQPDYAADVNAAIHRKVRPTPNLEDVFVGYCIVAEANPNSNMLVAMSIGHIPNVEKGEQITR